VYLTEKSLKYHLREFDTSNMPIGNTSNHKFMSFNCIFSLS